MVEKLRVAYKATFEGKFQEALAQFQYILHAILFLVAESRQEVNEIKELIQICREYVLGIQMELERKDLAVAKQNPPRQVELSAYFTHCKLQPVHLVLALRSAMNSSFKIKNYGMAGSFARRLLELNPKAEVANQARKVAKLCERTPVDQQNVNYDSRNPFVLCGTSHYPIYQGTPVSRCPYCSAAHGVSCKGSVCTVCNLAQIGKECGGPQFLPAQ